MKLCYIAGGISTHTLRIANYMAGQGHEVSIISYTGFMDGYHPSIHKYELKKLGPMSAILNKPRRLWWYNPFLPATMKALMLRIRPDITESHYIGPTGMLLARLANHHPHVMVCQGSDVLQCPENRKGHLRDSLLAADAIVVMSEQMRDALALGCNSHTLLVTNTGVDTNVFKPHAVKCQGKMILSTRQNKPIYDLQTLVKAFSLVKARWPEAWCVFVGEGTEDICSITDMGAVGAVPPQGMVPFYQSADLYISTALSDGTSISLLEAMATDLPCVLTDIPANRPWVEPEYLFKPGDPYDLARVILYTLAHPPKPGCNRQKVLERADFKTEMKKLERLYEELKQ